MDVFVTTLVGPAWLAFRGAERDGNSPRCDCCCLQRAEWLLNFIITFAIGVVNHD